MPEDFVMEKDGAARTVPFGSSAYDQLVLEGWKRAPEPPFKVVTTPVVVTVAVAKEAPVEPKPEPPKFGARISYNDIMKARRK